MRDLEAAFYSAAEDLAVEEPWWMEAKAAGVEVQRKYLEGVCSLATSRVLGDFYPWCVVGKGSNWGNVFSSCRENDFYREIYSCRGNDFVLFLRYDEEFLTEILLENGNEICHVLLYSYPKVFSLQKTYVNYKSQKTFMLY